MENTPITPRIQYECPDLRARPSICSVVKQDRMILLVSQSKTLNLWLGVITKFYLAGRKVFNSTSLQQKVTFDFFITPFPKRTFYMETTWGPAVVRMWLKNKWKHSNNDTCAHIWRGKLWGEEDNAYTCGSVSTQNVVNRKEFSVLTSLSKLVTFDNFVSPFSNVQLYGAFYFTRRAAVFKTWRESKPITLKVYHA